MLEMYGSIRTTEATRILQRNDPKQTLNPQPSGKPHWYYYILQTIVLYIYVCVPEAN
jgi:hypothetical protein